jgi:hypothetical protein
MTSSITTSGINTSYPVAGVSNDSQGFRDNFAAIKSGLDTAAGEITVLQDNAAKLNAANDFSGNLLEDFVSKQELVQGYQFSTSLGTGAVTVNWLNGSYQYATANTTGGTRTLSFSNFGTSGSEAKMVVELTLPSPLSGTNRILFDTAVKVPDDLKVSVSVNNGSGLVIDRVTIDQATGGINDITITSGGSGYTNGTPSSDTVTITGGGGFDATATVNVSGNSIATFNVIDPSGNGYTDILDARLPGVHRYEFSTRNGGTTVYLTNYHFYPA